jgi:hypothetical protein
VATTHTIGWLVRERPGGVDFEPAASSDTDSQVSVSVSAFGFSL